MDLELNRLSAVETPIHGEVSLAAPGESLTATLARDGIRFPDPFRVDGEVRSQGGLVTVTGHVTGTLELECGRCLQPMRQSIDLQFEARLAQAGTAPKSPAVPLALKVAVASKWTDDDDDGLELQKEDLDVSFLPPGTTVLRVEDVLREQVLLEVPIRPLCRPDCRGLCVHCGADLNTDGCDCAPDEARDLRLAGLAAMKKRLEDGSGPDTKN